MNSCSDFCSHFIVSSNVRNVNELFLRLSQQIQTLIKANWIDEISQWSVNKKSVRTYSWSFIQLFSLILVHKSTFNHVPSNQPLSKILSIKLNLPNLELLVISSSFSSKNTPYTKSKPLVLHKLSQCFMPEVYVPIQGNKSSWILEQSYPYLWLYIQETICIFQTLHPMQLHF